MGINTTDKVAFCTTALREFWDINKPLALFGEGCVTYSDKDTLQNFEHDVLEDPLNDSVRLREAQNTLDQTYETFLGLLTDALNALHGENMGRRYWRILIGIWLHYYLSSLLDRWYWVITALDKFPKGSTIGLAKESFQTPRDTIHHAELLKGDRYNLQLYTRTLEFLGVLFTDYRSVPYERPSAKSPKKESVIEFPKAQIRNLIDWATYKASSPVFLRSSYFSWQQEKELFLRSKGLISTIYKPVQQLPEIKFDHELRGKLGSFLPQEQYFAGAALKFLPEEIPQCFIEGYNALRIYGERGFPKHPKVIFSVGAYWYDEPFKEWVGRCAKKGSKVVGSQHGGNYGSLQWHPGEEHEICISDRYYTWGWDKLKEAPDKVVPFFATKFTRLKKKPYSHNGHNLKDGILMTITSEPRYALSLAFRPSQMQRYLNQLRVFIAALNESARSCLTIRTHHEEHGWQITDRLNDIHANFDSNLKIPFLKKLANCRLFVSDYLGTTWLESLALGKPSIFFFDLKEIVLRKEAIPYYDELKSVGVLFDDPIPAATVVNMVLDDPQSWWMESERQRVIQRFTDRFARSSKEAVRLWTHELLSFASTGRLS